MNQLQFMAKAVRKRGVSSQSKAQPIYEDSSIPQIQQFQDVIDLQKAEFESIKCNYMQQNCHLAKSNSNLLIKLRDMEKNVSEMVQENVILRSKLSMNELRYKEKLNEHIQLMEKGVFQRFEEIFHIFGSIRRREGLEHTPQSHLEYRNMINEPRSILKRSRPSSSGSRRTSKQASITFNEDENQVIPFNEQDSVCQTEQAGEDAASPRSKKRRRNSRRESLFIPADFELSDDTIDRQADVGLDAKKTDQTEEPTEERVDEEQTLDKRQLEAEIDDSCNFTNSIIEYSIPEEIPDNTKHQPSDSNTSKLDVYKDIRQESTSHQSSLLQNFAPSYELFSNRSPNSSAQQPFLPIPISSQKKIKHSMKPRTNQKKMVDEVMPLTADASKSLVNNPRARRTRGKAVNYTLPSLRAKMRRPTEKLVDATTVTDIHDLQVGSGRSSRSKSRDSTPDAHSREQSVMGDKTPLSPHVEQQNRGNHTKEVNDGDAEQKPTTPSVSNEKAPGQLPSSVNFKQIPLKDITNKAQLKSLKTKKLFKKPIVGDIGDENSCEHDEIRGHRDTFRVNENDLSVFDLLDDLKGNTATKTHRAKAKQDIEKRGRRPSFKL